MKAKIDGSGNLDLVPESEAEEALLRIWRERQPRIASTRYTTWIAQGPQRQTLDSVTIEFCEIKKR